LKHRLCRSRSIVQSPIYFGCDDYAQRRDCIAERILVEGLNPIAWQLRNSASLNRGAFLFHQATSRS
jgi:hypothetical protein